MAQRSTNKADLEYALMMTILNFHTEFMRSNYANVQVHLSQDEIEVTLTRQGSVPAERRLAESPEGRSLLRQVHEAMFLSCERILRERIEPVVERKVREMVTSLDPVSGRSSITIRL
ncbi:MAG: DUF2294 family protein [Nitrospira sp.]|nr:DUF2294 family protein [Nitrospira sp.]MBX3340009.1 DUF2294 family protein [Nitrospira sp.]MBX3369608.1 DUF2294 family protein [Nitrospira sp.]MBX7039072.1 DUF2294 domain-containing protein [Nitrospira sp.]MCW5793506.1 DUF2294 family protein [Nitrospira sp.]